MSTPTRIWKQLDRENDRSVRFHVFGASAVALEGVYSLVHLNLSLLVRDVGVELEYRSRDLGGLSRCNICASFEDEPCPLDHRYRRQW
jgi:hypothetical protein